MKNSKFSLFVADTETTGTSVVAGHEIIEISFFRLSDGEQKTWCIKPKNYDVIEAEALRINQHKIEDLKHQTKFGVDTYLDPTKAIVDIENWFATDLASASERVLVGQNIAFDLGFLEALWKRNNASDTFPFGARPLCLDTKQIALFLDLCLDTPSEFYNLASLVKKYGTKNEKAHSAASDTRATKNVLLAQMDIIAKLRK